MKIILPEQANDKAPLYMGLFDPDLNSVIALVQIPATLEDAHGEVGEDQKVVFFLKTKKDVEGEGMKFSCYELHSHLFTTGSSPVDSLDKLDTLKDGYVFMPKTLRDGRHGDEYLLMPVEDSKFKFWAENGMYEEVYWSPFGNERGAVEQEARNAEINPQLRRYNQDGLDKPDFS